MSGYTILITDADLNLLGDPILQWQNLDVTLKFNEPSSGFFKVPAHPWIIEQVVPGCRVVVIRNPNPRYGYTGGILLAGPMESRLRERSYDKDNAGVGTLTVYFSDDLAKIVARQTYPDPTLTPETQVADSWTFTGNAETALRNLVNLNAGPGALTARRIPSLTLGATASVGTAVTVTTDRMQPLGEVMRQVATVGGDLGFRTVQVGNQIEFQVYDPPDKSTEVRFSFGLGNLIYLAYELKSPKVTAAIVGGQGEGAGRYVMERVNAAEQTVWGRYETLVSRAGDSVTTALEDDGDRALADGASTVRVASNLADTEDQRYGVHYDLGTRVGIETDPGEYIADVVTTVHIQAWPTAGEYISATVGSQAANTDPMWVQRMRALDERLAKVERTVQPAAI